MDNLTHSLAGIVTAELVVQARRARGDDVDPRWARAAWLVSAGAHNAPDLDFVYTWITEGRLGYLLHHRGHTHTLALAPLMALLPLLVAWLWARRAQLVWTRADHGWLVLLAALGPLGHLWLDYTNNYGVHPFWPIVNRWMAGDTVFIVEPLFFVATIPMVMLASRSLVVRRAWAATLVVAVALPWLARGYVAWPFALLVTVFAALVLAATRWARERARPLVALAASALVLATLALAGGRAEARLRAALERDAPHEEIVDVARMPLPSAPPCWEAVVASVDRARDEYVVRVVRVSAWPAIAALETCAMTPRPATTAPLVREGRALDDAVHVESAMRDDVAVLRALDARCDGAAFLRFARVPFVVPRGPVLVLGDARYDREAEASFAELEIPSAAPDEDDCPRFVPPWTPWRAHDLLAPIE